MVLNSGFMLHLRYAESWITASVVWLQALKGVQWIYKGANVEGQKYRAISVLDNWPLRTPLLICWLLTKATATRMLQICIFNA